jgi:hypothetical protein
MVKLTTKEDYERGYSGEQRREGAARLVHARYEFYLGGIRFDAGTYEIKRVATPPTDEPTF